MNDFVKHKWSLQNWDATLDVWYKKPSVDQLTKYTNNPQGSINLLNGGVEKINEDHYWLKESTYV